MTAKEALKIAKFCSEINRSGFTYEDNEILQQLLVRIEENAKSGYKYFQIDKKPPEPVVQVIKGLGYNQYYHNRSESNWFIAWGDLPEGFQLTEFNN